MSRLFLLDTLQITEMKVGSQLLYKQSAILNNLFDLAAEIGWATCFAPVGKPR